MKPYYQQDGITIFHADCRDVLDEWEGLRTQSFDLLLTDPPYGIYVSHDFAKSHSWSKSGSIYDIDTSAPDWDVRPDSETLALCRRMCRRYVIWGGNYLADILGSCAGVLVWDKQTGSNPFADGEIAWSNVAGTTRIFRHQWCGAFKDSERGQRAIHPTQKPEAVMRWCLELSKASMTILDPYMGSGTTLVAVKRLGKQATGIEREERYCEIAAKRLSQGVLSEMFA